jgi:hypothetical protein
VQPKLAIIIGSPNNSLLHAKDLATRREEYGRILWHRLAETVIPCPFRKSNLADHHRLDPVTAFHFGKRQTLIPTTPTRLQEGFAQNRSCRLSNRHFGSLLQLSSASLSFRHYGRASRIILNGVSAARRKRVNPPFERTSLMRRSPACAPRARPTS